MRITTGTDRRNTRPRSEFRPLIYHQTVCLLICAVLAVGGIASAQVPLETGPGWTSRELEFYGTGMVWRDCNNDGTIDVFYSNGNDAAQTANTIYLFGQSLYPDRASWFSANEEYSGQCAVGDIDDDGLPDFFVANYWGGTSFGSNYSDLYMNSGGIPETSPSWQTPASIYSYSCALGDPDGDGDLDIAFATGEPFAPAFESDLIYANSGGTMQNSPLWESAEATASLDAAWGDVDNDGDLDLALARTSHPTAVFYNQSGVLETTPTWTAATTELSISLVFGDINGDGWLDLVVANNDMVGGSGRFCVYFNDGSGHLDSSPGWQSSTEGFGSAVAVYDYDNDGDDDLAAGRWWEYVWIYENTGSTLTTTPVWASALDVVAESLAWVDIDGGGVLDMADTVACDGGSKLFYTDHHPLYAIDSVFADQARLGYADYCYDLESGWLSLGQAPVNELRVYYRFSKFNDLAVANWDTVNMVFENTTPPYVDIDVANSFGPVPLLVDFTDQSSGATGWLWNFGDGTTSDMPNPTHEYSTPGAFDVSLRVTKADGEYERTFERAVSVYADTLRMTRARLSEGQARVDIYAHHHLALSGLVIPFGWNDAMDLRLDSQSVSGLRTEYFDQAEIIDTDPVSKSATLRLAAGSQQPLPPGDGPVASLFFTDLGSTLDTSLIYFADYSGYALEAVTRPGSYRPETVDGSVYTRCCEGRVGNANNQGGDEPTIGDIVALIDMLYISFGDVYCLAEADVNQSGGADPERSDITIGDISRLIDYLYVTGPQLGLPDCY